MKGALRVLAASEKLCYFIVSPQTEGSERARLEAEVTSLTTYLQQKVATYCMCHSVLYAIVYTMLTVTRNMD